MTKTKKITISAMFTAIIFVVTTCIRIPMVLGYVNLGDSLVLITSIMLGPLYGSLSAGIGSAFSDMISYPQYIVPTFIIKSLVSYISYIFYSRIFKSNNKFAILGFLIAEIFMVLGYFCFESLVYGVGYSVLSLTGNSLQGVVNAILATAIIVAKNKISKRGR